MQKFLERVAILLVVALVIWILLIYGDHWFFRGT